MAFSEHASLAFVGPRSGMMAVLANATKNRRPDVRVARQRLAGAATEHEYCLASAVPTILPITQIVNAIAGWHCPRKVASGDGEPAVAVGELGRWLR